VRSLKLKKTRAVTGPFDQEKKATGEAGAGVVQALVKNNWVDFKLDSLTSGSGVGVREGEGIAKVTV
jgi:hypothetical protein